MARPKRFELLTPRFVVWCSIQLSYGRARCGAVGARTGSRRRTLAEADRGCKSGPARKACALRRTHRRCRVTRMAAPGIMAAQHSHSRATLPMTAESSFPRTFPVSWEELHRHARALAWRLLEAGPFTGVVAVTRG